MESANAATLAASWLAIAVSLAATALVLIQNSRIAELDRQQTHDASQSEAVIHFTNRFHELTREGERFDDEMWTNQYWGLLAAEFFFFDRGWVPSFIYELWIIELVRRGYHKAPGSWESHRQHLLEIYSEAYPEMTEFFHNLHDIAVRNYPSSQLQHQAIVKYVRGHRDDTSSLAAHRNHKAPGAQPRPRRHTTLNISHFIKFKPRPRTPRAE